MCDLYIFGSLIAHRKTKAHQQLRKYLHPQCSACDKEFTVRTEWEEHKMEAGHMQKMIKAGDDYVSLDRVISRVERRNVITI